MQLLEYLSKLKETNTASHYSELYDVFNLLDQTLSQFKDDVYLESYRLYSSKYKDNINSDLSVSIEQQFFKYHDESPQSKLYYEINYGDDREVKSISDINKFYNYIGEDYNTTQNLKQTNDALRYYFGEDHELYRSLFSIVDTFECLRLFKYTQKIQEILQLIDKDKQSGAFKDITPGFKLSFKL